MIYHDVMKFSQIVFRKRNIKIFYNNHKRYLRIGSGYDIETTRKEDKAYMYHWQFSFGDDTLLCRTWSEFEIFVSQIRAFLKIQNAMLIVWVANLGHEFSFLCRRLQWDHIFARESRQPLIAQSGKIEFREALTISGKGGLANLAKKYTKTQKLKGDLDYNIPRNSMTVLEPETEEMYTINDVKILSEFGEYLYQEYADKNQKIPLTSTGIVRNSVEQAAIKSGHYEDIKKGVKSLFPTREIYNFIMRFLYRGGYTHANAWWVMVQWEGVIGADFTSSYPAVMLHCEYPKSPFMPTELETNNVHITDKRMKHMCCWFIAEFYGIERTTMHTIESEHKIIKAINAEFDNGRLRNADMICVALTEVDYHIYELFYRWEGIKILKAQTAFKGRLPNYLLSPLMHDYKMKKIIKDSLSRGETKYTQRDIENVKARINSYYGMCCTRLCFENWLYNQDTGEWYTKITNKSYKQLIDKQILSPWWGIYITCHARAALLESVYYLDSDETQNTVLYCDTDSAYMLDTEKARKMVDDYNRKMQTLNEEYSDEFYDIGCFDWIGGTDENGNPMSYRFMSLGAKRYLKYHDGIAEITVAGMRKGTYEKAISRPFATKNSYTLYKDMKNQKGKIGYVDVDELFSYFTDGFILNLSQSDKNASVYYSDEYSDTITDEQGHTETMSELCGMAIVPIPFSIHLDEKYIALLDEIMHTRRHPVWR